MTLLTRETSWDTPTNLNASREKDDRFLRPAVKFARRMSLMVTGTKGKIC